MWVTNNITQKFIFYKMNVDYNKVVEQYKSTILNIFLEIDYYFDDQESAGFCYDKKFKELYPFTILNYIKYTCI